MKDNLTVEVDGGLTLTVRQVTDSGGKGARKINISLFSTASKMNPIAEKSINWPATEELPQSVEFSNVDEIIWIKGGSTIAKIPMKLTVIQQMLEHSGSKKIPSFFGGQPKTSSGNPNISSSIRQISENPTEIKLWREFATSLSSSVSLDAELSSIEQHNLLGLLRTSKDLPTFDDIASLVIEKGVFNYKYFHKFAKFCIENGKGRVIQKSVTPSVRISEEIGLLLLKEALSQNEEELERILDICLSSNFSQTGLTKAVASVLSGSEAVKVANHCLAYITGEPEKATSALSFLSALLDGRSSQFIWDSESHAAILDIAQYITDLSLLIGSFSNLTSHFDHNNGRLTVDDFEDDIYKISKLKLTSQKLVWNS